MAETPRFSVPPTRRSVVAAAGGVGLAAALTACGGGSDSSDDAKSGTVSPSAPATTDASSTPADSPATSAAGGGKALGKTADIPVGGGKIYADEKVVVTQPTAGQFKAFSATCTHQGCLVASVSDGTINCACHGSKFHVADGSVAHGPATAPLSASKVTVSGDSVTLDS